MYDQFEKKATTNLTNVFIKANLTTVGTCLYVVLPNNVFSYGLTESIVTNLADEGVSSNLDGSTLNMGSPEVIYYKVAISPDFSPGSLTGCAPVNDYILGSILERQIISAKKLLEMKERYFSDYDNLKNELGVPGDSDFAITSEDFSGIDMIGLRPTVDTVQTNEYLAEVLLTNGTRVNARFLLWAW